jgi:ribonucleoside-triphosphate reductase
MSPRKSSFRLPDDFVEQYSELQPEWGPLGWITYKRTYARWADAAGTRREEWYETVRRVVEGNINLDPRERTPEVVSELEAEAKEMFHTIFNLAWTPPGRGLWISGTSYAAKQGDALVNCWNLDVKPGVYEGEESSKASFPFVMGMDLLMKGGGLGFNATRQNVMKFPLVSNPLSVHIVCDPHHPNIHEVSAGPIPQVTHTMIRVEDSREGWYNALRVVIDGHFKKTRERHVVFDVSDIRPFGTKIAGFGGTAAGPGPLVKMLADINALLNDLVGTQMSSVEAVDMMNIIGRCVVAGNVRRSAELALGSADDLAFIAMKQNQEKLMSHRWASNNSIAIDSSFEEFDKIAQGIIMNGEPGIVNLELARTRLRLGDTATDDRNLSVTGTNPCGEIVLGDGESCNLAEIYPAIVEEKGFDMERILRLALRYTKRVTCANYSWPTSQAIVSENRRVGVSLSGIRDWMLKHGVRDLETKSKTLDRWYGVVRDEDKQFSAALGIPESVAVTTVKPSGTVSLLNGSSPGLHAHWSPYMIRRVRFQHADPLVDIIKQCGFHVEDDAYSPNTVVAEFPVAAPNATKRSFVSANDLTIDEQLATQASLQRWWSDNSVSATITFKKDERKKIAPLLREYRDQLKSTSLLAYQDPTEDHSYVQPPYESITKERYEEMVAQIDCWPHEMATRLHESKKAEFEIVGQDDCIGGACPVR